MHSLIKQKKILVAHSNTGLHVRQYHARRESITNAMGYNVSTLAMADFFPYVTFPQLDRLWRRRNKGLMEFYEMLGKKIDQCDIFLHMNGALIHPDFLSQFKKLKVYHCADDPDASAIISRPVANFYDIQAISNPACIEMYKEWGCKSVFFWPLGSPRYVDFQGPDQSTEMGNNEQTLHAHPNIFYVGSKYGTAKFRFVSRIPLSKCISPLWMKKGFFTAVEREFPSFKGYGEGWASGLISNSEIDALYKNGGIGLNIHNSLGPINERLYDLAAFGICQICDNKDRLSNVFEEGSEIIGFSNERECFEVLDYYIKHPVEARLIGAAAQKRYLKDYTIEAIWLKLVVELEAWFRGDVDRLV